jgi:hypothetical protein
MTRPKASSIQETQKVKALAQENLYLMRRLVNATKSVNFQKYDEEFRKHKKFVKNLERMGDQRSSMP